MQFQTVTSPHLKPETSVRLVMGRVLLALLPGLLAYVWLFGPAILTNMVIAIVTALTVEAAMLLARGRSLPTYLGDLSAILSATLLALALPPGAPWWLTVLGMSFAMIFGKHLYGGLGNNPFNPAMIGYVVLLISFPLEMSNWQLPADLRACDLSLLQQLALPFGSGLHCAVDTLTMATPLDVLRTGTALGQAPAEVLTDPRFGLLAGKGWEWVAAGWTLGGLWLLAQGTIRWQIPGAMLASLTLMATLFWLLDSTAHAAPWLHLFGGASLFGAFFIATDPVSASTTVRGRLIFGAGIGVIVYAIRSWGGYPDGVAFAVLLMNIAVPLIDAYTQPRVIGHVR